MEAANHKDIHPLFAERLQKVSELASLGHSPYNIDFSPTVSLTQARELLEQWEQSNGSTLHESTDAIEVSVAGRVVQLRLQGKSCFCHIEDSVTRMQAWFRLDVMADNFFEVVRLLDLGDIIGIHGTLMRTRRGEPTVLGHTITVLAKALHPPPEKYHGLNDPETRVRKRYLDLLSHPEQRVHFSYRSSIIRSIRSTLDNDNFLEVETPILNHIYGGENAAPFTSHWNALHSDMFLRISLELYLKRLLVGGYEKVYELGRVFRNEGLSPRHNPEFTLLEAYASYGSYVTMRDLSEKIITSAAKTVPSSSDDCLSRVFSGKPLDLQPPFRVARMVDLIAEICGFNPLDHWDAMELKKRARYLGIDLPAHCTIGEIVIAIFENCVEPTLWNPTFVLDYPVDVSPLARRCPDDPRFVERFELYIAGYELINAFSELNDPIDQRKRFEEQLANRVGNGFQQLDEDFLEAIETGMPPAGGMGMGVDRLIMLLTDTPTIRDVILFPALKPASSKQGISHQKNQNDNVEK